MAVQKIHINEFLELGKQHPVLDVRSPGEYNRAHIPGAISFPLFTDEERKEVGTAYKQQSRETAIKIGLDYFGPRMRKMVEEAENLCASSSRRKENPDKTILIHCWRGGMRSGAVAWLLDLYGFKVYALIGGYKKYRNRILDLYSAPYSFKILGGYTGSGKTYVLKQLQEKGEYVIDLEDIAKHKGSAFGNIGMPAQPSQEMFENLLGEALAAIRQQQGMNPHQSVHECPPQPIWLEDESQRIGDINMPYAFWKTMRQSPVYFLEIPFEERLKHISEEYGKLDRQRVANSIGRIQKRLGGLEAKTALQHWEAGQVQDCFRILLKYYDKWYGKGLHNRENLEALLQLIPCETVNAATNAQQLQQHKKLVS